MAEIVKMPKLGFDMAEGTLARWIKQEGESVTKGEILADIETDKATVEVESPQSGIVFRHLLEEGSVVPIGTPIAVISAQGEIIDEDQIKELTGEKTGVMPAEKDESRRPAASPAELPAETTPRLKVSPLARRLAVEKGIDLNHLTGSGPGGRIMKRDVEAAKPAAISQEKSPSTLDQPIQTWSATPPVPKDELVPLDKLREIIGRRMTAVKQEVPHFYVTAAIRVEELVSLRKKINASLPKEEKISVNDLIVKAAAMSLKHHPNLNASLQDHAILHHGDINIGVAVSVPGGLINIVCQNADQKTIRAISGEVRELAARARAGRVRPADIEGSTFSISNLGMYGVDDFIAIINPPEAAILAVGSIQEVPVVENGAVKAGMILKVTLSADHRITDGAEAAQFLQTLVQYLENPLLMLV